MIEYFIDNDRHYAVFHTLFGRRVNDALSRAVAYALSKIQHKDIEVGINDNSFYVATNSFATNLTGNRAENTADGFVIISSSAPTLRDNYVIGGTGYGYHISVVTNANFSNDTVIGKPSIGFYFDTYSGEFKGLYAENNSNYGVYSSSTSGSTVFNNTYLVNNSVGVGIKSTQTSMYNTHIKQVNNNFIKILDSSSLLKLERNTTIENIPTGTSVRYPNLVELDTTDDSIDEVNTLLTTNLASINTTYTTELATAANITLSGVDCSQPNLNVFRAPGFPQSVAEVIATGTVCNAPTCTNKQCSGGFYTFDVSTFSGYSTTNISSCMVIGSPGDYALTSAVSGAPITVSDVYGITRACIVISASNVTFSCAGYKITNNGTLDAAGILVNGSSPIRTNVTIKDCPYVAFYEQGVYLHYTNRSIVQNTTSYNNTENGFYLYYSNENNLTNNIAYNNTNRGVYVHYSNYNRIRNITAYNQQSSSSGTLSLYSGSYNILTDNNIYNNTGHGIFVSVSGNNTIANNSVYNNGYYGIYFYYGGDNKAENNTVYKNYYGFYLDTSPNALLSSNDVYNNTYDGFELRSSKINVTDNRIRYNGGGGVYGIGSWFIIRNNTIYNNSQHGIIILNSDNATVVENNISNHLTYQSISFSNVKDGVISNNVIFKGYRGVETDGTGLSQKINITNNIVYNMSDTCLSISCTSCRIINNTAYYCGSYGISLGLNENIIENNTAYNNSRSGFYIHSSKNNCTNNTAYFNTQSGFYVYGDYNNIIDNVAYNNSQYGFATYYANANNFTNNTAYSNTLSGFYISDFSDNNTLFNNTAYDNNQYGIYVNNVNRTVFVNTHVYANKPAAAYITLTYRSINVSNLTVDNPVGNFQNYTQLSFYHFNPSSNAQAYTINWTRNSTALPVNRFSFAQKFVDISTVSGTVSINSVTWHWLDSELGSSYKENYFELWKYNASGWTLVNNSPDTSANTLSLTNMNPASIYGILQYNASECMLINLSGEYSLRNNVVGAPIDASPLPGFACIKIATSNVLFDCAGYNITDNGTAAVYTTYGILLNGSLTNVTVRNCPSVSNYTYGIWVHQSENSTITNSTSHNNTRAGVYLFGSSGINITNIGAHNNSNYGIYLYAGGSNRIENSSASGSPDGFYINASSSNTLSSNLAYNNSHAGFHVRANGNTFNSNNASNNSRAGFFLNQSNNSVFTGDTASNNLHGFEFDNAHFNTLTNATAFGNNQYGFEIYSSTGNNFTNILVYGNGIYGFKMVISDQNILTNVTARDNTNTGVYINTGSDYNLVRNSSFYNNSGYGFGIEHSMYNNVTDSYAYENAQGGFLVWDHSYYNKITNCTAYNNSGYGLTLSFGSENNTLLNITAYNNSGGIKFDDVYTNNATDVALYMNNRSDGYELYFSATSQSNIVTNTFLYTTSNYVLQEGMSLPENNLSNFSIGYNSTIGIINWRLLNITNITLNSTNVIPYIDFVSLNDSRNPQANKSANVTIIGPSCDVEVLVKRGYPLTRAEILADGTRCTNCNIISCNKTTHVTRFDVPGWSGYTLAEWCFYADTPNTVYNLTRNLRGNKSDQICITVNASNVTINCAGFNVTGYEPGVTWGIKAFDVFGIDVENCTVSNYTYGLEFYNVNHSIIFNVTSYNNSEGILISYGTNNTLFKNIAYNNTDGIFLSSTSKNNLADNTAFGNTHGFILMSAATTNNTLNNNTAYNNSQYGFYLYFASNNTMANNIAYNNTAGFTLSAAKYNSISDNTAHNNSNGFYLLAASNNTLNNNTAFYNAYGFYVNNSADNNLTNCTAYNNSYHGFYLLSASTNNLLSDNLAKFQGSHGFVVSSSLLNKLTNNTAYRNSCGFAVDSSSNNTLAYNFAYNNTVGFALQTGSSENNLTDNLAYFNKYGFRLEVASDNRLENNSAFNNSVQGGLFGSGSGFFITVSSEKNMLINNSAYDNELSGFFIDQTSTNSINRSYAYRNEYGCYLYYGESNNIIKSSFYNNSKTGVYLNRSSNMLLDEVNTYNNQKSGLYLDSSPNVTITNCTAANNSEYGIAVLNANNTVGTNIHLYNNDGNDVYAFASASYKALYLFNLTIDNPAGNFENYTSLTINDTLEATALLDNGYTINWTRNSSALPPYRFSFREKYVEITNITSSVSIDSITWHWLDSEVTGDYNESKFELWKYNVSGWTLMNDTPNVSANILGLTNMNPASTYGILQRNVSGCQVITTPGSYQLSANAEGAPFDASPLLDYVCVKIASSDVLFDCAGYNITDNGTAAVYTTYGILLNGSLTNVTVRNCPSVSNYTYGIYVYQSENSTITNSTSHNNMADGIKLDGSNYNNLTWDAARGNSNDGFYLIDSSYNVIEGSTAYDNSNYGFRLTASATGSTYNNLTNNTAYNNYYGFVTVGSSTNNRFVNNTAHDNSGNGFYISSANNTLIENDAYSNNNGFEQSAFFGPPADGNYYESNAAFNNSYNGFILFFVSYNVFVNNTAYNNSWALYGDGAAFSLRDSSYNNLSDNLAYDNYEYAFRLDNPWGAGSAYNRIINNTVRNHGLASFYLDTLANNNTINSNDVQNSTDGFVVHGAENNITNNLVYNHTGYGVYIEVNPSSGGENRNRVAMNNISLTSIGVVVNISLTGTIINNIINDSGIGIAIYGTNATDVSDNRVHNISQYGIEIAPAESGGKWSVVYGASFNNITYNNIFDIGEYGVYVHPYYNGSDWFNATDNQYLYNTITRTGRGMYLNSTSNNNITGNNISNSSYGLYIDPSYNNTIIENNLYNNSQDGLYLEDSHNNTIRNNTAYNNSRAGFYLVSSTENNLSLNNITNNTLIGLYLNSNSNSNSLSQNYICFND
ncbi:MAG: right-handed parallel beta-helix repeat-containing protein, partial [Halobacteria archaeon]